MRPRSPSEEPAQGEARDRAHGAFPQIEADEDEQARAFVVETLQLVATACFADASALRSRSGRAASAAARSERAGRYAEAAARWLTRNGANALLGQGALLAAFIDERPALEGADVVSPRQDAQTGGSR